jgi:general secretion pathway protein A
LSESDLLKTICRRLDIQPPHFKNKVISSIQQRIGEMQPINPILILDEMQNATIPVLDAVRLLANDNFDTQSKLSVILIGTPEFFDKLSLAINESLSQRITLYQDIQELDHEDTTGYIAHCLADAGAAAPIFEPSAIRLIHDLSRGSIRIINKLAYAAMTAASLDQSVQVILKHVQAAQARTMLIKPELIP